MGNDGGSIPKRRELVKEAARLPTASEAKESQQEQLEWRWSNCKLSQKPLRAPVVSDCMGNLYNKDAVLEFLLPSEDPDVETRKADAGKILEGRVRSLKDIVEVKFQEEEEEERKERGMVVGLKMSRSSTGTTAAKKDKKWLCPITNKQLGPTVKAAYLVPCGHAFSEAALKEVAGEACLQCNEKYAAENIISILPVSESEKLRLRQRIENLKEQSLAHSLKKASGSNSKKRKKNAESAPIEQGRNSIAENNKNGSGDNVTGKSQADTDSFEVACRARVLGDKSSSGLKNAATASLTARVLAEEQDKAKRRKLEGNENLKSLFSSGDSKASKNSDFMTRGFSIPAAGGGKR